METDENNPISTSQVFSRLRGMGIVHIQEMLPGDIDALRNRGDEMMSVMKGHNECYYVEDRYFNLVEGDDRVCWRGGHGYVVELVALVFNEDNYYLVVCSGQHGNTANYRVYRMNSLEIPATNGKKS